MAMLRPEVKALLESEVDKAASQVTSQAMTKSEADEAALHTTIKTEADGEDSQDMNYSGVHGMT